jgi:ubiquinone/menaquinone biosynthesis C-methylase UbiE
MIPELIYDTFMAPFETFAGLASCRKKLLPEAFGRVLEVGPGTGVNSRYYRKDQITSLTLIVPEGDAGGRLEKRYRSRGFEIEVLTGDVQALPFPDGSFDTVVATLLFCSVSDPLRGLKELKRVVKPGGRYLFMEHVKPEGRAAAGLADFVTPAWKRIAGGCHLNRETSSTIVRAGFQIDEPCSLTKGVFVAGLALAKEDA